MKFFQKVMAIVEGTKDKEMSFRFLDYDNNGAIGSVDILNL